MATLAPSSTPSPTPTVGLRWSGPLAGKGWQLTVDDDGVVLYDLDTQTQQSFATRDGGLYPPCWAWSPDGSRIIYNDFQNSGPNVGKPHQHWIVNLLTGKKLELPRYTTQDPYLNDCLLRWHPQDKAILLEGFLIRPEDGSLIGRVTEASVLRASWNADGQKLAYVTGDGFVHLAEVRLDTSGQVSGVNTIQQYCWVYDGKLVCGNGGDLPVDPIFDTHWSPAKDTLAILTKQDIYLYDPAVDRLDNLTRGFWEQHNLVVGGYALTWSPDGQKIAFYTYQSVDNGLGNSQVFVVSADGSGVNEITGGDYPYGAAPAWSPDSAWVFYSEKQMAQIVAVKLDGSERLLLPPTMQGYAMEFRPGKSWSRERDVACTPAWTRLAVGQYAAITDESAAANRVRSEPVIADNVIANLGPGMVVKVIEGPVCVEAYAFWKVENSTIPGGSGWTAEGDGKSYWLAPYGSAAVTASPTRRPADSPTPKPLATVTPSGLVVSPTVNFTAGSTATPAGSAAITWVKLSVNAPTAWRGMTAVYNANRKVVVLFGGTGETGQALNETWEFDGRNWKKMTTPQSPPARFWHGMAYDAARGKVVVYGGWKNDKGDALDDTWEYDGQDWTSIQAAGPGARGYGPGMVYDSCRQKVVLFGGAVNGQYYNDTWEYNGESWTKVAPQSAPSKRALTAMTFDTTRCVAVLFGGMNNSTGYNDTWEYNGVNWSQIAISTAPAARWAHAMTYHPLTGQILLFGGYTPGTGKQVDDTWVYAGQTWQKLKPTRSPAAREQPVLVFDGSRVLLYGGFGFRETWQFEP